MPDRRILSFGSCQLDLTKEQLWCDSQPVRLTPKALQVLCLLLDRPGQLVTKEELFRIAWADTVVSDAALTTCIQEIRKALQDNAKTPQYLETVPRRGFRFIAAVVRSEAVVSSQHPVISREEPFANRHEVNSVMPACAGIQDSQVDASGEFPWIPASAGMTPPPSSPQIHNPSLQLDHSPFGHF